MLDRNGNAREAGSSAGARVDETQIQPSAQAQRAQVAPNPIVMLTRKKAFGWPQTGAEPATPTLVVSLSEALTMKVTPQHAAFDAHGTFLVSYRAQYATRLNKDAIGKCEIAMQLVCVDVDGPGHEAPDAWFAAISPAVVAILGAFPAPYFARSRGGFRLFWRLAEEVPLRTQPDADAYEAGLSAFLDELDRIAVQSGGWHGGCIDRTSAEWNRLQRIPHDCRDGVTQELAAFGNPSAVGAVTLPMAPALAKPRVQFQRQTPPACPMPRTDAWLDRARDDAASMRPAVKGSGGTALFGAACRLMRGWLLPRETADRLLRELWNPRCSPPWDFNNAEHAQNWEHTFSRADDPAYASDIAWGSARPNRAPGSLNPAEGPWELQPVQPAAGVVTPEALADFIRRFAKRKDADPGAVQILTRLKVGDPVAAEEIDRVRTTLAEAFPNGDFSPFLAESCCCQRSRRVPEPAVSAGTRGPPGAG